MAEMQNRGGACEAVLLLACSGVQDMLCMHKQGAVQGMTWKEMQAVGKFW